MKLELDVWREMWDRAGSQGLDIWYELPGVVDEEQYPDSADLPNEGEEGG